MYKSGKITVGEFLFVFSKHSIQYRGLGPYFEFLLNASRCLKAHNLCQFNFLGSSHNNNKIVVLKIK